MATKWRYRWRRTPYSLCMALGSLPVGILGAFLGSQVSRAITEAVGGVWLTHVWGGFLAFSGLLTLAGIATGRWLLELAGLRMLAAALLFYSICCYFGLGVGGIVSGTFALVFAVGSWGRALGLLDDAKENAAAKRPHD